MIYGAFMSAYSWNRKVRFLAGGIFNFCITYAVLLSSLLFLPVGLSSFLSALTNLLLGYSINKRYVFNVEQIDRMSSVYVRYGMLSLVSWLLNWSGIELIHFVAGLTSQQASILMIPLLTIFSYLGQSRFVFRARCR